MAETTAPYGRRTQRAPAVKEVRVVRITAGLGCDGDSVSIAAATQPSLENVILGAIPGLPKVHPHDFMKGKDPRDAHFITSRICGICFFSGESTLATSLIEEANATGLGVGVPEPEAPNGLRVKNQATLFPGLLELHLGVRHDKFDPSMCHGAHLENGRAAVD
jgi:hypothetical protein